MDKEVLYRNPAEFIEAKGRPYAAIKHALTALNQVNEKTPLLAQDQLIRRLNTDYLPAQVQI